MCMCVCVLTRFPKYFNMSMSLIHKKKSVKNSDPNYVLLKIVTKNFKCITQSSDGNVRKSG